MSFSLNSLKRGYIRDYRGVSQGLLRGILGVGTVVHVGHLSLGV